jgi:hypothetical protein
MTSAGTFSLSTALTAAEMSAIFTTPTTNYLQKYNGANLANSLIYDNGTRVGIGTKSPVYKMDINTGTIGGGVNANGLRIIATATSEGAAVSYGLWVDAGGSDDGNYAANFNTGSVGIANATPTYQFQVGGTGSQGSIGINTAGVIHPYIEGIQYGGAKTLKIATQGDAYYTGGNIGIGTKSPLSTLCVNGGVHIGSDSDAGDNNLLVDGTISLLANNPLKFYDSDNYIKYDSGVTGLVLAGTGGCSQSNSITINASGIALHTLSVQITTDSIFLPAQHTNITQPGYVKGAIYFNTTLNKLMVGGATGWETVTSV